MLSPSGMKLLEISVIENCLRTSSALLLLVTEGLLVTKYLSFCLEQSLFPQNLFIVISPPSQHFKDVIPSLYSALNYFYWGINSVLLVLNWRQCAFSFSPFLPWIPRCSFLHFSLSDWSWLNFNLWVFINFGKLLAVILHCSCSILSPLSKTPNTH